MDRRSLIILTLIAAAAVVVALTLAATRSEPTVEAASSTSEVAPTSTTSLPDSTNPESISTTAAPEATSTTTPDVTLAPGSTACDPYSTISVAGEIASRHLVEASGMAASRTSPGVLWAHNDSRDGARIYAVDPGGGDLGGFDIAGALAFDWEDMAAGPGSDPTQSMLFLGDIGDNFSIRGGRITVYRVPEPDPASISGMIEGAVPLEYQYPDGVYNAEALFVADGSIFIVTKDRDETRVYRGNATGDGSTVETLQLMTVLPLGAEVSGADVSWDGSTIAFRGYNTVWMWHRPPGTQIAEALTGDPCTAPSPDEVQGESIAFLSDGSYATVSEGSYPDLHVVERRS
ncbi:MAG: hypothetical protein U9R51_00145 [Actinomycetota bacterium]|nr:hypothetical protein [Actinomycetota bacterium]